MQEIALEDVAVGPEELAEALPHSLFQLTDVAIAFLIDDSTVSVEVVILPLAFHDGHLFVILLWLFLWYMTCFIIAHIILNVGEVNHSAIAIALWIQVHGGNSAPVVNIVWVIVLHDHLALVVVEAGRAETVVEV